MSAYIFEIFPDREVKKNKYYTNSVIYRTFTLRIIDWHLKANFWRIPGLVKSKKFEISTPDNYRKLPLDVSPLSAGYYGENPKLDMRLINLLKLLK